MQVSSRRLSFLLVLATIILVEPLSAQEGCDVSHNEICITAIRAQVNRCAENKQVIVDFKIRRQLASTKYKYSFKVSHQPAGGSGFRTVLPEGNPTPERLETESTPQELTAVDYQGDGNYKIEVVVEDEDRHRSKASIEIPLRYRTHVYALLVGVSKYKFGKDAPTSSKEIKNLQFADKDADSVEQLLRTVFGEGVTIEKLQNDNATASNIQGKLKEKRQSNDFCSGDLFIFYFSGHTLIDSETKLRYLGTHEIDPSHIGRTGLSPEDLYADLAQIAANKLVMIDSCFSGVSPIARVSRLRGGKAVVVKDGEIVDNAVPPKPDQGQIRRAISILATFPGNSLLLAAVDGGSEAQEMHISPTDHTVVVGSSQQSSVQNVNTPTVGHGLYTYLLISQLQKHMAKSHKHGDLGLGDNKEESRYAEGESCYLDFPDANLEVARILKEGLYKEFELVPRDYPAFPGIWEGKIEHKLSRQ
jgi:hypothetical protein